MGRLINRILIKAEVDRMKILSKLFSPAAETNPNKKVLELLGLAWPEYLKANDHQSTPQDADNLNDFRKAIHDAQRIVATRELQLVKPEFFK